MRKRGIWNIILVEIPIYFVFKNVHSFVKRTLDIIEPSFCLILLSRVENHSHFGTPSGLKKKTQHTLKYTSRN